MLLAFGVPGIPLRRPVGNGLYVAHFFVFHVSGELLSLFDFGSYYYFLSECVPHTVCCPFPRCRSILHEFGVAGRKPYFWMVFFVIPVVCFSACSLRRCDRSEERVYLSVLFGNPRRSALLSHCLKSATLPGFLLLPRIS